MLILNHYHVTLHSFSLLIRLIKMHCFFMHAVGMNKWENASCLKCNSSPKWMSPLIWLAVFSSTRNISWLQTIYFCLFSPFLFCFVFHRLLVGFWIMLASLLLFVFVFPFFSLEAMSCPAVGTPLPLIGQTAAL